ncbi:MAG TPA: hypothetical protein VKU40_08945 [Thermoanaerobaculia bacterium]|nr:hypothetical protein [Thermoanaerobaculia bacterium]
MARIRVVLVVLGALLVTTLTALPAAAQFDFGNLDLGEIDSLCVFVCFTQGSGACDAGGTFGTFSVTPPFEIGNFILGDVSDDLCNDPQLGQVVDQPVTLQAGQILAFDIDLVADRIGPIDGGLQIDGQTVNQLMANGLPAPACPPSANDLLCLEDERFTVRTFWRTRFGTDGLGPKVLNVPSDDSGLVYFFNPDNWEILIKVLDGCSINNHFWVFAAATTNVEYTITVTDTQTNSVRTYSNPLSQAAAPIQDTSAFATCP